MGGGYAGGGGGVPAELLPSGSCFTFAGSLGRMSTCCDDSSTPAKTTQRSS